MFCILLKNTKRCINTVNKYINRYLDITTLPEKFEHRLNELYRVKDKWSYNELLNYLRDYNIFNLEEKLQKYCKQLSEINQFDNKKNIILYALKIKL